MSSYKGAPSSLMRSFKKCFSLSDKDDDPDDDDVDDVGYGGGWGR